jgi:Ca-activated chloride channel homolog
MALQNPHKKRGPQFSLCLISVLGLLFGSASINAQEPQGEDVIRIRTDLVAVPVIITDGRGRRVPRLKTDDFSVSDEGHIAKVDYFASGTDRVALLFALDASGSAREIFPQQREAAFALFSRFGHGSRVAVLHFGDFVRLSVAFTGNSEAAQESFNFAPKENSGTAIFDAAAAAVSSFDGSGGFSTERRIVLLMSDGLDTLSSTSYKTVTDRARTRGVSFYVIHFPLFAPREGRLMPRPASKGFRELAEATGGRYFQIGDAKSALSPNPHYDLSRVFQAIEDDLRGQYVLGFYPGEASRDNHFHRVTVSLTSRNKRRLRLQQLLEGYDLKP